MPLPARLGGFFYRAILCALPTIGLAAPAAAQLITGQEATSALRTLEFRYRNVPRSLVSGEYTGFAQFEMLPDGGWIIKRWWIRAPMRRGFGVVTQERSGEVLRVEPTSPGGLN